MLPLLSFCLGCSLFASCYAPCSNRNTVSGSAEEHSLYFFIAFQTVVTMFLLFMRCRSISSETVRVRNPLLECVSVCFDFEGSMRLPICEIFYCMGLDLQLKRLCCRKSNFCLGYVSDNYPSARSCDHFGKEWL